MVTAGCVIRVIMKGEPMSRLIDENDIIKMLNTMDRYTSEELTLCDTDKTFPMNEVFIVDDVFEGLDELPSAQPEVLACGEGELIAQPERRWIPFKRRKPTEEEGTAFDYIMDCKCPEDGQNILVSINIQGHEPVQYDTFYGGGGEECCLESDYELVEEATAWMPLPEPYKAERRTDD